MAKGWEHFSTVNDVKEESAEQKQARARVASRIMRTTKTYTEEELKKNSDKLYAEKIATEDRLVELYGEKKLKSKRLIREARIIIKRREEEAKKAEAKKAEEASKTENVGAAV